MPKASDLTPESRFFGLFVGESGSGKTVAECSFPGDIDVDDFDGRIRGILGAPWIDKSKITYNYYPPRLVNSNQFGDPNYIKINKSLEVLSMQLRDGQSKVKTKVADSLTSETFCLLCDVRPLTHEGNKGKKIGQMLMSGGDDYNFEATGTYDYLAGLRSLAVQNIIVSAHMVDRFGKADPENPYSESIVTGKKLSIRDKIGTNIQIYFDHVFEFYRKESRFFVKFRGEIARTSYADLPNGEIDITGKDFYKVMMGFIKK